MFQFQVILGLIYRLISKSGINLNFKAQILKLKQKGNNENHQVLLNTQKNTWFKIEHTTSGQFFNTLSQIFRTLKLVSVFLFFSPNGSPSKTMKNAFYFIKKTLFVLEIIKCFYFRLSLFFSLSAITLEDDRR